jgi:predicted esterase
MDAERANSYRARSEMRGVFATAVALAVLAVPARAAECPNADAVKVPGAEMQKSACLDDLTTAGTTTNGHTDESDWAGLTPTEQRNPTGVPGLQVDGYFPDTSTFNNENGWFHDAQFVIRFPDKWNGKLVITGAPGIRKQYSVDPVVSDFVLARGYAFASTDKGNSGVEFFRDGATPGDAIAEWNQRVTQLTIATKEAVRQRYGRAPSRTYVTGISNGGYLTRWQLENRPELYDGGVDWEGTLFTDTPNLFTYLPVALRNYPKWRASGDQAAHDAMIRAGFAPGSELLWDDHYGEYWDLTQRTYREEIDPDYDGPMEAGTPFCQPGTPNCDADYDWARRPASAHDAMRKFSLTGRIGKPMLTLHGTLDALLPIATDSDVYTRMIDAAGRGAQHRYYVVEHANHVDGRYDAHKDQLRPLWPCWAAAFVALEDWVEKGSAPPPSQFVPDRHTGDLANECTLARGADVIAPGPSPAPGGGTPARTTSARVRPRGLSVRVRGRGHLRYRTTGRVVLPASVTRGQACGSGVISVQVKAGRRTVSTRRTRVRADCTFRSDVAFRRRARLGRHRLKFTVRFFGNRVLTGARAKARFARIR